MKRLRRRLFNCIAAICLPLFIVVSSLWVRSLWVTDLLYDSLMATPSPGPFYAGRRWDFTSAPGMLMVKWTEDYFIANEDWPPKNQKDQWSHWAQRSRIVIFGEPFFGDIFHGTQITSGNQSIHRLNSLTIYCRYWWPTLILGTISLVGLRRLRHWLRLQLTRPGFCSTCGYDIRATPKRCPECGAIPRVAESAV